VAAAALSCMQGLAHQMFSIFTQFSPLKPVFASKDGLMMLIKQPNNTATLVHVVRELCNTSSTLEALNLALHDVSGMFVQIQEFFHNILSRIGMGGSSKGRRLSSWTDLLGGLNFKEMAATLKSYLEPLAECTKNLLSVSDVIGPMMIKLDETFGKFTGNHTGRRLIGVQDVVNLQKNQAKYSAAIAKVIPTWQAAEGLGVKMCPTVALSHSSAGSLKCRVSGFVKQAGISLGSLGGLVSDCGGDPSTQATQTAKDSQCPAEAHSASLKNVLGENAASLGWILAIVAALGLLGAGGGAAAMKTMSGGDSETGDEEEGDSQGEDTSQGLVDGRSAE